MKDDNTDAVQTIGGLPFNIPEASAVPETKRPKHRPEEINYADDEEIAMKTTAWLKRYYDHFTSQGQRDEFLVNCDTADELFRASADRTSLTATEDDNLKVTGSHVKSSSFYVDLRTISAYEQSVMLGNRTELPMVYNPVPKSDEFQEDEGQRIAEEQNATLYWAFTSANMWDSIADLDFFTNKYGNQFIEMDWCYKTEKRMVRKPKGKPEDWEDRGDGVKVPTKFELVEEDVVVADHPSLIIHDNKDAWSDCMIPKVNDQSCVLFRKQKQLGDLYNMQATGQIVNVEKIKSAQAYEGENTQDVNDLLYDRQKNANEAADSIEPNTLIDIWRGYIRIPVKDGKWDERNHLPVWHKFAFAGTIEGSPVALLIQPNRWSDSIPVEMVHSHKDDKGLYHDGYVQRVKSILAQEMTTLDQATDNWTQRNCAPLIADEGSLLTRRKEYADGRRPILYKKPGSKEPTPLKTDDTTQLAVPMLNMLQERRYEVMGINKTFRGQELGGRTSAGEALTVFDMARKPAYEDIIYKAGQILPFIAEWVKEFTRAYMSPDIHVQINYKGVDYNIAPGALYGELKTKLTFVEQFEDSLIARKEEDVLLTQVLPVMISSGVIGKKGLAVLFKNILKRRNVRDVDDIIEIGSNFDAERMARQENEMIVYHGVNDMPMEGEDHATHLKTHESFLAQISLLPADQRPPEENIALMRLHVERTKQLMDAEAQGMQAGAQQLAAQNEAAEPRTPGESVGDMMGAQAGMEQNPSMGAITPEIVQ